MASVCGGPLNPASDSQPRSLETRNGSRRTRDALGVVAARRFQPGGGDVPWLAHDCQHLDQRKAGAGLRVEESRSRPRASHHSRQRRPARDDSHDHPVITAVHVDCLRLLVGAAIAAWIRLVPNTTVEMLPMATFEASTAPAVDACSATKAFTAAPTVAPRVRPRAPTRWPAPARLLSREGATMQQRSGREAPPPADTMRGAGCGPRRRRRRRQSTATRPRLKQSQRRP